MPFATSSGSDSSCSYSSSVHEGSLSRMSRCGKSEAHISRPGGATSDTEPKLLSSGSPDTQIWRATYSLGFNSIDGPLSRASFQWSILSSHQCNHPHPDSKT